MEPGYGNLCFCSVQTRTLGNSDLQPIARPEEVAQIDEFL